MQITVHYRAFDDAFDVPVPVPDCFTSEHTTVLEGIFENTNLYSGPFWNRIEPALPRNRRHTALSVGDEVTIDGTTYRCEDIGWSVVSSFTP